MIWKKCRMCPLNFCLISSRLEWRECAEWGEILKYLTSHWAMKKNRSLSSSKFKIVPDFWSRKTGITRSTNSVIQQATHIKTRNVTAEKDTWNARNSQTQYTLRYQVSVDSDIEKRLEAYEWFGLIAKLCQALILAVKCAWNCAWWRMMTLFCNPNAEDWNCHFPPSLTQSKVNEEGRFEKELFRRRNMPSNWRTSFGFTGLKTARSFPMITLPANTCEHLSRKRTSWEFMNSCFSFLLPFAYIESA